ncbi:hypothetical protein L596_014104 [Steinernema carpocapsae]|uniref:Protein Wnt n=2 Tax=Steinernema carpocapsae TaxID=34508 RepID=A0A4U5NC26_STECR|nr:hypothetical protein L596_014104 [Steinernema carpocapsae]
MTPRALLFLLSLTVLVSSAVAIKWLAMHRVHQPWTDPRHCPKTHDDRKSYGLNGYQGRMCRRITELMPIITKAAKETVFGCAKMFADRRWNCSSLLAVPYLRNDLTKGTKEQAFVYALSSAAITHQVAKACVSGQLPYCPCGKNSPTAVSSADPTYKWKGCSDNVFYGMRVSHEWADAPWRSRIRENRSDSSSRQRRINRESALFDEMSFMNIDFGVNKNIKSLKPRMQMNQHNNNVGRQVTELSMYRKCKCHGVSSSCTVKTCWNTLPDIVQIAHKLREIYDVSAEQHLRPFPVFKSDGSIDSSDVPQQNMVYLRKSPNYCVPNLADGSLGTQMRECNVSSTGSGSCSNLCCGRGYNTQQVHVEEQCQCRYVHCCYVKCNTCKYWMNKYYCK